MLLLLLRIYLKARNNPSITVLFLLSTAFFVLQKLFFWSWDFSVYLMNAQHFFSSGPFLEIARPPLASLIIGVLHYAFTWKLAEYAFIILVSVLFCYSSARLADYLKINRTLFYALELSPFVLSYGTFVGTELLSLAFLQLGLAFLSKPTSGFNISLAGLAHYTNFLYAPLVLLRKKGFFLRVFLYTIPILLWLAYNYFAYGSPWASIADSYLLNVRFQEFAFSSLPIDFLIVIGFYVPFLVLGLKELKHQNWKSVLLVGIFALITLIVYIKVPQKEARYLFNLAMPVAYLASLGLKRFSSKKALSGIVAANFVIAIAAIPLLAMTPIQDLDFYQKAAADIDCACASNAWVALNYFGTVCEPAPRAEAFGEYVDNGYRIVIFKNSGVPQYPYEEENLIKDNDIYTIFGSEEICKEPLKETNKTNLDILIPRLEDRGFVVRDYREALLNKNL